MHAAAIPDADPSWEPSWCAPPPPLPERYERPASTLAAVARARARGTLLAPGLLTW